MGFAVISRHPLRCAASRSRQAAVTVVCGGKRRPILRLKSIPANQRQKRKYQDVPKKLMLDTTESAGGRLTSEINGANGPQQLFAIVTSYSEGLSTMQLSMVLARLAAMKLANSRLTSAQRVVLLQCASRCIAGLKQTGLAGCDHSSLARISLSLARLSAPNPQLLEDLVHQSE